jgi:hypothetical protein
VIVWVRIEGTPIRQFCADPRALPFLDAKLARHDILSSVGVLRSSTDASNANMTITLRNDSGQASALFTIPPLGARARIYDDAAVMFDGTVSQIDLTATDAKLLLQA